MFSCFLKTDDASAASYECPDYPSAVTSYADLQQRLDALINRYNGTYWTTNGRPSNSKGATSKSYYGIQCKGFANYIFANLFCNGNIGSYDPNKYFIPDPQGATLVGKAWAFSSSDTDTVKDMLNKSSIGDFIQVRRRGKSYGHSMIVQGVDANGIAVFDCNSDGKCGVRLYYQTWEAFATKNSGFSLYHSTTYPPTGHIPEGYLESVTSNEYGMITAIGWTADRDAQDQALEVHFYIGGPAGQGRCIAIIKADASRADVGQTTGLGDNHGFCADIDVGSTGRQEIFVYAINVGGGDGNLLLGRTTVDVSSNHRPKGGLDMEKCSVSKGRVHLEGTGSDQDTDQPIGIHVYVDDKFVNGCMTDQGRFSLDIDALYGKKNVNVYAIDPEGGKNTLIRSWVVDVPDDCPPMGKVEGITINGDTATCSGWVFDEDSPQKACGVHIYEKDPSTGKERYVGGGNADIRRKDVGEKYKDKGVGNNHGFNITFKVKDGKDKTFVVYGINNNSNRPNTKLEEIKSAGCNLKGNLEIGYLTEEGTIHLEGWGFSESAADPIGIHVYLDQDFVGGCTTTDIRTDVADKYKGIYERCGFNLDVDAEGSGKKTVSVYAIDPSGGDNLLLKEFLVDLPDR